MIDRDWMPCYLCGKTATETHHLLSGTANRKIADRYKLTIPLCADCHRKAHDDPKLNRLLKRYGQEKWMIATGGTVDEFIKEFGKNYIGVNE